MRLALEIDREEDGRWIAEVVTVPGALAYGSTQEEAVRRALALALSAIADKLEHGELHVTAVAWDMPLVST